MAIKSLLFLLAFMLALTRMHVIAVPAKAPAHAPMKAPVQPPSKAPVHAPAASPIYFPKPPVYPTIPLTKGCVAMCMEYCKTFSPKRPCMRTCKPCCDQLKCVPNGIKKCPKWNKKEIIVYGRKTKCPCKY